MPNVPFPVLPGGPLPATGSLGDVPVFQYKQSLSTLTAPRQTCTHPGDVTQFDEQIELQRLCDAGKKTKAARKDGRGRRRCWSRVFY